jgi:hypothetical protein
MALQNIGGQTVTLPDKSKMMERLMKIDPCPMSGWQDVFSNIINSLAGLSMRGDGIAMVVYVQVILYSRGTGMLIDDSAYRRRFAKKIIDAICDDLAIRDFAKKYLDDNLTVLS